MTNNPTMDLIRVNKKDLIAKLTENRATHHAAFEEAMAGYKTRAIELLEEHIERIKAKAPERVMVNLPMPQDHTDDYDRVIDMLDWSQDDDVWVNAHEFSTYVNDEWFWKEEVTATNALYSGRPR